MKTFTTRVTWRFALLVTATTLAVLTVGGFLLDRQIEHGLELLHDIEATELAELLGNDGSLTRAGIEERIKHDADSDAALFVIQVSTADGNVLFRSDNLGETLLPAAPKSATHWTTTLPFLGRVHVSAFSRGPWRLHIGSALEPSERLLRDYIRISSLLVLGVAVLSLGLGYAFSRATLRPIRAIEATANRIHADNLAARIPLPAAQDELASLTRLLNEMFDRLQASFEQVRRFTADASHELKTPLALIRLNAEKLRRYVTTDAEGTAAIADILEEIARLQQVVERLLFLAKSDGGALTPALRTVDAAAFISDFSEDAQALAEDRGIRFQLTRNDRGVFTAEPDLLRQLLLNLVTNAVNASPSGGQITLESARTDDGWSFVLLDEGPGLQPGELARLFGRFVRFEHEAPPRESRKGHGLGLAICKSIVDLHRGVIRVENRGDRSGLRVTVELPVGDAAVRSGILGSGETSPVPPDRPVQV